VRRECNPICVRYNLPSVERFVNGTPYQHPQRNPEAEGRTLILEYPTMFIINTYVPHNGYGSVLRGKCKNNELKNRLREQWNRRLQNGLELLQRRKPIIWAGDLNVAHTDLDVTHPYFFATVEETRMKGKRGYTLVTQPGFTRMEKENFGSTLAMLNLVDTFRYLHNNLRKCS